MEQAASYVFVAAIFRTWPPGRMIAHRIHSNDGNSGAPLTAAIWCCHV